MRHLQTLNCYLTGPDAEVFFSAKSSEKLRGFVTSRIEALNPNSLKCHIERRAEGTQDRKQAERSATLLDINWKFWIPLMVRKFPCEIDASSRRRHDPDFQCGSDSTNPE